MNATLGLVLKVLTFPLTIVTFGLFLIVINAIMLKMAAAITPGFEVRTWKAAFIGAILLSIDLVISALADQGRSRLGFQSLGTIACSFFTTARTSFC